LGFENIRYILLSANNCVHKIANSVYFRQEKEVPKVTTIDFLINRFWFKLNKGFGGNNAPRSIDVVSKAQIVLSFLGKNTISEKYEEIKIKFDNKEISKDQACASLVVLKEFVKNPDDIQPDSIEETLKWIDKYDLQLQLDEMESEKVKRKSYEKIICELEEQQEKDNELSVGELRKIDLERQAEREKTNNDLEIRDNKIFEMQTTIDSLIKDKDKIKKRNIKIAGTFKRIIRIIIILLSCTIFYFLMNLLIDNPEFTGGLSLCISVLGIVYSEIKDRRNSKNFEYINNN